MKFIHLIVTIVLYTLPGYCQQKPGVVINEFMADPAPVIGLPNYEWVELLNTTDTAINLMGWRIADGAGTSNLFDAYILPPGGYLIVCGHSALAALSVYGPAISVTNFPSLNNSGDIIQIKHILQHPPVTQSQSSVQSHHHTVHDRNDSQTSQLDQKQDHDLSPDAPGGICGNRHQTGHTYGCGSRK